MNRRAKQNWEAKMKKPRCEDRFGSYRSVFSPYSSMSNTEKS